MAGAMKKKVSRAPLLGKIFRKLAPEIGARVVMEPEWNIVGQIIFKNGRKRYFRYSTIDLNPVGAADVAKDKDYANFFMRRMGYPTIDGKTFFSGEWAKAISSRRNIDAAYRYAKTIGFPVFVKPNSGSQGLAVAKVNTKKEFYRAMREIFRRDRVALVQRPVSGTDYRIVVLNGRVISAYARIPLSVIGDGKSSVLGLIRKKQRQFVASGRDTRINPKDRRIAENLKRQGFAIGSKIPRGKQVWLLSNANLSTGGDALDVTSVIHPGFRRLAARLTEDMGLRFCGVDLMVAGDISKQPGTYWVIEVNAAPGLDHYVTTGRTQEKIVEAMYRKVLKAMA